jgi:cell fate regulator YaaT (PSP1 superfamily)
LGRCTCLNGQRLGYKMEQVEPLPDIVSLAKSEDRDCVFVSDRWADRLNGIPDPKITPKIMKAVEQLINLNNNQTKGVNSNENRKITLFD